MTMLLAFVMVAAFGTWIPLAQLLPGVPQRSRIFYVAVGNLLVAAIALLAGGVRLELGWRGFWLPLAGGAVWTAGNYSAFRAAETIGLARAAGTWTPLNIITAFAWGALLFGELDHFSGTRFAILGAALLAVLAGVLLIVSSQGGPATPRAEPGRPAATARGGLLWAGAAGLLWGSYFVPAQWAAVPAQVSNFPLAIGILLAALALALPAGERPGLACGPRPRSSAPASCSASATSPCSASSPGWAQEPASPSPSSACWSTPASASGPATCPSRGRPRHGGCWPAS